ncbi:MAG: FtsX-like permease family protein, partial [bacterium]|nr:FtsX-like permease family protein [bacterium]
DPAGPAHRWVLTREYRSTYRDSLFDTEEIVAGTWVGSVQEGSVPVPVSPAEDVARRLGVTLGDTLVFDVQGIPITAVVQSLREIDWQRVQPNFWMVFPRGVLEPAPQFYVLTTRVGSAAESAILQRELVSRFSNVSVVDLGLVLQTVDDILSQVGFVIRFMALFSVLTGLAVLASAVLTSRYQRIQEGVLLRTLGASRRQIVQILLVEYFFLGALAALTGLLLSVGGGWALAQFVFGIAFAVPGWVLGMIFVLVTGLTVVVGMLNSRGIAGRPPLEVLRAEV